MNKNRPQAVTMADSLDALIERHKFVQHPFNQAWATGKLSRESLQRYAVQYDQRVRAFPENLKQLAVRAAGPVRELIEETLAEELNPTAPSLKLWRQFAHSLGVSEATLDQAHPLPPLAAFLDTYEDTVSQGTVTQAIAGFYVYEAQVPELAAQRIAGLRRFYGVTDPSALTYFDVQLKNGPRRAAAWRSWLASQDEADAFGVLCAAERCLKAVWGALDAVYSQPLAVGL